MFQWKQTKPTTLEAKELKRRRTRSKGSEEAAVSMNNRPELCIHLKAAGDGGMM